MKKLIIVESPAKVKTITKFLGKDFKIMASMGHVKDLPENTLGVHMNDEIVIDYVVLENKEKTIADICKQAQSADEIFLAPDPDREGEIIAWHIAQEVEKVVKQKQKIHRIAFNEITKDAILDAVSHPGAIDLNKVAAQQARRVLDRWVGYEVSPVLWKKLSKGLSAGRVQSVALKLIVRREDEIRTFVAEEYWSIEGTFVAEAGTLTAALTHINKKKAELVNEVTTTDVVARLKQVSSFVITAIKDSKRLKNPHAPFMTSTLQQAAYNQLGFGVDRTMQIAQKLYEGVPLEDSSSPVALITYMRTDSTRISETATKAARTFITQEYGKEYVPSKTPRYSAKEKAQDAHEAIRPIDIAVTPEKVAPYVTPEIAKVYELIWKRFVACQMQPAQYAQRQVLIEAEGFTFKATGSTLLFDGFLKVYSAEDEEEQEEKRSIPKGLQEKDRTTLSAIDPKQHFTQPPPRYTQASLVKELEKEGIGRPSTYATILKTIQARAYTSVDQKKRFVPTELGSAVVKMLDEHLPKIMNPKFTAIMEEALDKIAQGEASRDELLRGFYGPFEQDLTAWLGQKGKQQAEATPLDCPSCNQAKLLIRFGKSGSFLGCARYPDCPFTSNFERAEDGSIVLVATQEPALLDEKCPECGKQLRQLRGKFGPFIACSGYPECKYIHKKKASFACPSCKNGEIIQRTWKGSIFWGCSAYPTCKFSISGDIEDRPCPQCNNPYILKRNDKLGNTLITCANKECSYKESIDEAS